MEEALKQQPSDLVKVVLFGPESTGKTTLARALARHYNTEWVPEYAREYLQEKWDREGKTCEAEDLLPIARGQMRLENELSKKARGVLICDTDLLETKVYSEAYYLGSCDPLLEYHALQNQYDLYLLTSIDIPWEKDDLRDKPNEREAMFQAFRQALVGNKRRFITLKGSQEQRLQQAVFHINILMNMDDFNERDLEFMASRGIASEKIVGQIETFKEGIPNVALEKPAVVGDGIVRLSEDIQRRLVKGYRKAMGELVVLKFIPASGAASRMFKALFSFLEEFDPQSDSLEEYLSEPSHAAVLYFKENLKAFPFYEMVNRRLSESNEAPGAQLHAFISELLGEEGLNYGFYPKGLLPFHKYESHLATPFEEHLWEGAAYARAADQTRLHFTISPQHKELFNEEFLRVGEQVSGKTGCTFAVDYSFQRPSTDTLAVTPENKPFRDKDGNLLFRPGGHGALIENLDEQKADILFIKNIDNVVVRDQLATISHWKEILGGLLLELQREVFHYTDLLQSGKLQADLLLQVREYLEEHLNVRFSDSFSGFSIEDQVAVLRDKLNRPIRVCGMVKNEGEPGGGPFWIRDSHGHESLQIVESAQVDMDDPQQKKIFEASTHFNPVDLACGVRDGKGNKYNLRNFVDARQGFITEKTYEGRPLKALELPGLWNGGMAYWNTVFVEVPVSTFNPVKTVNDLLKPAHRGSADA
jgi:nicotinamide riboside kinase